MPASFPKLAYILLTISFSLLSPIILAKNGIDPPRMIVVKRTTDRVVDQITDFLFEIEGWICMLRPNAIAPLITPENHSNNSWLNGILSANFINFHKIKYGMAIAKILATIVIAKIENVNDNDIEPEGIPKRLRPMYANKNASAAPPIV